MLQRRFTVKEKDDINEAIREYLKKKINYPECDPQLIYDNAQNIYKHLEEKKLFPFPVPFLVFERYIVIGYQIAQHDAMFP